MQSKKSKGQSEYTNTLIHSAEQRINFIYLMLMIAFEAAILIYVLINTWDDSRYYFAARAGGALLPGIVINIVFRRKSYPWIRYFNNLLLFISLFYLCGYNDLIAVLFILFPFINSFYMRPYFTAATGAACVFMLYVCSMSVAAPVYNEDAEIVYSMGEILKTVFDYSDEMVVTLVQNRILLLIIGAVSVIVSVYLSADSRRFTIRQGELMQKNLSAETELNLARNIQEGMLSVDFPDNESYALCADMTTATAVGGDFYDYFLIDESHLAIVIGDVSGHGLPAAMFMTLSKTLIKVYAQAHYSADKVFELTNRYLQQSNPAKFFVTGWMGIVDLTTGVLTYANAGHAYPVVIRAEGAAEFLRAKPNFVLGRKRLIRYNENQTKLNPGDKLILYTDGVTEASAPDGELFGDDRLLEVLNTARAQDQKELIQSLRGSVNAFAGTTKHSDDVTLLALFFRSYLTVDQPDCRAFVLNKQSFDSITAYIGEKCREAGCGDEAIGHITIASSEILANIDSYCYDNGGEVEILTKCRDRRMTVVFRDNGAPFNPLSVKEPDVTVALKKRKPGGLGIYIVRKLMSDVSYTYQNGQNVLTIEKDF